MEDHGGARGAVTKCSTPPPAAPPPPGLVLAGRDLPMAVIRRQQGPCYPTFCDKAKATCARQAAVRAVAVWVWQRPTAGWEVAKSRSCTNSAAKTASWPADGRRSAASRVAVHVCMHPGAVPLPDTAGELRACSAGLLAFVAGGSPLRLTSRAVAKYAKLLRTANRRIRQCGTGGRARRRSLDGYTRGGGEALYASTCSRRRRIVDRTVTEDAVLHTKGGRSPGAGGGARGAGGGDLRKEVVWVFVHDHAQCVKWPCHTAQACQRTNRHDAWNVQGTTTYENTAHSTHTNGAQHSLSL